MKDIIIDSFCAVKN
jgi:hypothetical protein